MFQVELLADENADDAMLPDIPQLQVYYAQLLYIARVTIPQNNKIRVVEDSEALLGIVRWCKGAVGDASLRPVWYTEMGSIAAVNIATIQCAVGCQEPAPFLVVPSTSSHLFTSSIPASRST
jgi:hypothetical protein